MCAGCGMDNSWTTIGDIATVFDGPHATPKKISIGPYFLSISSLAAGRLDLSKSAHLSEEEFIKWTKRVTPRVGDVLFSYETRLGEVALMAPHIRACLGRRMGLLRPKKENVIPAYLLYAYMSPAFQSEIQQRKIQGCTVERIAIKEFPVYPIRIPSLTEQKNVVAILSALDAKIELNNCINTELEAMAKTLYDYWFVQFDFPYDFEKGKPDPQGKPYKSSGGKMVYNKTLKREIPVGWEVGELGQVAEDVRKPANPRLCPSGTLYVGLEHIGRKQFSLDNWGVAEDASSQKSTFERCDFLFGKLRPYFHKVCQVPAAGICSTDVLVIRPLQSNLRSFVGSVIFQDEIVKFATKASGGTRMPRTSWKALSGYKLVLPPKTVCCQFNNIILPIWERCNESVIENQQLAQLRDWLLPMLMNGQVCVETENRDKYIKCSFHGGIDGKV